MLGVCCQWIVNKQNRNGSTKQINAMNERSLQLGRYRSHQYTDEAIINTYVSNLQNLYRMIDVIARNDIKLFRISSSLFPLFDQVDRSLWDNETILQLFVQIGERIRSHEMRVCVHPGQFCVLSSDSQRVVDNSVNELTFHGWMFDKMGLDRSPRHSINVHGGKSNRTTQLTDVIKGLHPSISSRLTLENDESSYSVVDLLEVHKETGTPIVWDSHHSTFNDGDLTPAEASAVTKLTWPDGIRPLQHISNTEPGAGPSFSDRRKHSQFIHYVPDCQLLDLRENTVDVEVECKKKNIGVFKMASDFDIPLF